ncbi:MAG: peptidase MA family metallohydrolase [Planctomycetota bacterium]
MICRMKLGLIGLLVIATATCSPVLGQTKPANRTGSAGDKADKDDALTVEVTLLTKTVVEGDLVMADDKEVVLTVGGAQRTIPIEEIHPLSLFYLRREILARDNPRIFVEWGRQFLDLPYPREESAQYWFDKALAIDPTMISLVEQARKDPATPIKPDPNVEMEVGKHQPSSPEVEKATLELAEGWHQFILKNVNKKVHLIETEHFLVYSTWDKDNDRGLAKCVEKLYKALCKQFTVPKGTNIWCPKLPIYAFWRERDYKEFVMKGFLSSHRYQLTRAGGFCFTELGTAYVVLNYVNIPGESKETSREWFYELLVHETTHAFNGRYLSDVHLPTWYNEGIAEYMAATLVPRSRAARWWKLGTRYLLDERIDVAANFEQFRGSMADYLGMQSMVRYMMHGKKKKKFIQFYKLLKAGKSQEDALMEAYGWDFDDLEEKWRRAARGV